MPLDIALPVASVGAMEALERFLPSVGKEVSLEVSHQTERPIAMGTLVSFGNWGCITTTGPTT